MHHSTPFARSLLALGLYAVVLAHAPQRADADALDRLPPAQWIREGRVTYAAGRHYATDRSTHPTHAAAISRSIHAPGLEANLQGSARGYLQPFNMIGVVAGPLLDGVRRARVPGGRLDAVRIAGGVAGTFAGGLAGTIGGAAIQSTLAGLGPVGVAAGFLARPVWAMLSSSVGSRLGRDMAEGRSWRDSAADTLRDIRPLRDFGGAMGGSLGAVIGQALIPVPILGAMIGGMVGGMLGGTVGSALASLPGFRELDGAMRGALSAVALWIARGRGPAAAPAPEPGPQRAPIAPRAERAGPGTSLSLLSIGAR